MELWFVSSSFSSMAKVEAELSVALRFFGCWRSIVGLGREKIWLVQIK